MQIDKSQTTKRLESAVRSLLENDFEFLQTLTDLEKSALIVGLTLHRRQIKTEAVNHLLEQTKHSMLDHDTSLLKKLAMEVDFILEKYDFNFKSSEIELEFSDALVEKIKSETRSIRLTNPKIADKIAKLAKKTVTNLNLYLGYSPVGEEEIKSELYEYLIKYGEEKYDPRRSAYNTFATMILDFRAKHLFKHYMTYYSKNQLTDFSYRETEREQEQHGVEKYKFDVAFEDVVNGMDNISYMDLDKSVQDPSFEELSFFQTREIMLQTLSPLEKAVFYLVEVLRVSPETFPFYKKEVAGDLDTRSTLLRLMHA